MITGFTSDDKLLRDGMKVHPATVTPITNEYRALDTRSWVGSYWINSGSTEPGSTTTRIISAVLFTDVYPGDMIRFVTGALFGVSVALLRIDPADTLIPVADLPVAPTVGDLFFIERYVPLSASVEGYLNVSTISNTFPNLTTAANVARGKIAGTSLTGSYATLLSMGAAARHLSIFNSCDQTVLVSFNAGSTDTLELDAGEYFSCDYASLGLQVGSSTIQAKHNGVVPTSGSIRAVIVR